jgi:hypothetical protein
MEKSSPALPNMEKLTFKLIRRLSIVLQPEVELFIGGGNVGGSLKISMLRRGIFPPPDTMTPRGS